MHAPGPYELGLLGARPANTIKEVTLKRTLATIAAAVGVLIWTAGMGAATQSGTAQANSAHTHTARPAPTPAHSQRWAEDSLPPELYLWQQVNSGDLQRWGRYDGHRNCWAAVADTTLVMCPDGYYTTT